MIRFKDLRRLAEIRRRGKILNCSNNLIFLDRINIKLCNYYQLKAIFFSIPRALNKLLRTIDQDILFRKPSIRNATQRRNIKSYTRASPYSTLLSKGSQIRGLLCARNARSIADFPMGGKNRLNRFKTSIYTPFSHRFRKMSGKTVSPGNYRSVSSRGSERSPVNYGAPRQEKRNRRREEIMRFRG